jgi:thiamine pyrophosphate-dependent acetolactate synthase large subunit-like protein
MPCEQSPYGWPSHLAPNGAQILTLDWVAIAGGFGVPAERVEPPNALVIALGAAFAKPGPHLIEALLA